MRRMQQYVFIGRRAALLMGALCAICSARADSGIVRCLRNCNALALCLAVMSVSELVMQIIWRFGRWIELQVLCCV